MNGFVRVNDTTEQIDNGVESPTEEQTIGFYTEHDIPFYYNTASNFAINDRYFASVLGPTFPNRSYLAAATSFGHLTTSDTFPPTGGGYKPVTGTIFDLLDKNKISWAFAFRSRRFHRFRSHTTFHTQPETTPRCSRSSKRDSSRWPARLRTKVTETMTTSRRRSTST